MSEALSTAWEAGGDVAVKDALKEIGQNIAKADWIN